MSRPDPVAAALVPAVLRRVRAATSALEELARDPALDPTPDAACGEPGDGAVEALLERLGEEGRGLGWVLAVVASASGQELLLARRERRGLEALAELLADALAADGRALGHHPLPLPDLDPAVGEGWAQPWALACLVLAAGRAARPGETLAWRVRAEPGQLVLRLSVDPGDEAIATAARALPGVARDAVGEFLLPG